MWHYKVHEGTTPCQTQLFLRNTYTFENPNDGPCNEVSEKSASCLRRLKNWFRTTMSQTKPNYLILLLIHKNKTDELKLIDIANQFFQGYENKEFNFGKLTANDFPKLLPI